MHLAAARIPGHVHQIFALCLEMASVLRMLLQRKVVLRRSISEYRGMRPRSYVHLGGTSLHFSCWEQSLLRLVFFCLRGVCDLLRYHRNHCRQLDLLTPSSEM